MADYQPLDAQSMMEGLDTQVIGREVTCFEVCDSTNERARQAAESGAPDGAAFFADAQTAGRGRQGRTWLDQPGACLLLSVLLRPAFLPPGDVHLLTILAATATAAAVEAVTGLPVELKWPNDVVIGERKLAGILVETSLVGELVDSSVVGIGLNVNLDVGTYPEIADSATSLSRELGRPIDRLPLARQCLRELDRRYVALGLGGRAALFAEWRSGLGTIGRRVEILDAAGERRIVLAEDVAPDGALIGTLDDGTPIAFHFGEVSLRAPREGRSDGAS